MKKLFTLLTLVLCVCTGAWAEDPTVTVTWFPSTMTSENFSVAGTASVTGLMTVNNATHSQPVNDPEFRNKNVGSTTTNWAKFTSSNVNVNGSNKNRWLATDYITFSVTIADGVIFTPTSLRATVAGSGTGGCGAGLFETRQTTAQSGQDNGIPKEENGGQNYTLTSFSKASYSGGETLNFYIHIGIPSGKAISVNNVILEGTYAIEPTDPATAPTFNPNGGAIDGTSTITIGSDATHTYYQWSDTEVTLTKDSEGWLEGKSVTAPNVTSTKYLYAYATNGDGLESSVVSKAFNITKVKLANGLAYAATAVTKKVGYDAFINPLTNPNELTVTYSIADGATAAGTSVNPETGEVTLGETAGTATIKATFTGNEDYLSGEATYTLTLNAATAQTYVTKATTWDFSNTGANVTEIELTGNQHRVDVLIANVEGYNIYDGFDSKSLVINGDRLLYNSNCCQISALKFHTTVPGTVDVTFSNTGGSSNQPRDPRYLTINGVKQTANSTSTTQVVGEGYKVPAGDVVIGGLLNDVSTFIRVYKIIFTPATNISATTTSAGKGWATLYTPWPLDFANATPATLKAYTATLNGNTVTLTEVQNVPAGTGVVLKSSTTGENVNYSIPVIANSTNDEKGSMVGSTTDTNLLANTAYILNINGAGKAQFFINSLGTIAAGKAYLPVGANPAKALSVVFANDMTGITNANAAEEAAQPAKRIVNGQLVIEKNGKRYNAAGAEF